MQRGLGPLAKLSRTPRAGGVCVEHAPNLQLVLRRQYRVIPAVRASGNCREGQLRQGMGGLRKRLKGVRA